MHPVRAPPTLGGIWTSHKTSISLACGTGTAAAREPRAYDRHSVAARRPYNRSACRVVGKYLLLTHPSLSLRLPLLLLRILQLGE